MNKQELVGWIEKTLNPFNLHGFQVDITGTSLESDGYLGDINFVKVKCYTSDDVEKVIHLAVKTGKFNDIVRKHTPIRELFQQEINIYTNVMDIFKKFVDEKSAGISFNFLPKCYNTFMLDHIEVIIFEDLKAAGYKMHDTKVPLSIEHFKLLLQALGKFHAMSYVLQDQRKEYFKQITSSLTSPEINELMGEKTYGTLFRVMLRGTLKVFKDKNRPDLHEKVTKWLEEDIVSKAFQLLEEPSKYKVVIHGDLWSNNLMFHYSQYQPDKISIIDWQLALIHATPVHDLSLAAYNCLSPKDLNQLGTLLQVYHKSFSELLIELGSDPEKLYPLQALKDDWNKFAVYGFLYTPYILKQIYWDHDVYNKMESTDWTEKSDKMVVNDERYIERLIGAFDHFFSFNF